MLDLAADLLSQRLGMNAMARLYTQTPRRLLQWLTRDRFHKTVLLAARHSRFYREAFAAHGIDPRRVYAPADLGDFYTTPEDLATRPEDFICRPPSIVFESSGTSGRN
jgi:phenylacetate-coenzyme A ligase PaaK-like adenylate-forming protein